MKIHIVGAGIGGLSAAISLAKCGFEVVVVEQESGPAEQGAGIQLGPNVLKVLFALGCEDALRLKSFAPNNVVLRNHISGKPLLRLPLRGFCEQRYGAPYLQMSRLVLANILRDAALAAGVQICYGSELLGWHQNDAGLSLQLADKTTIESDLLIGADGIRSKVRTAMHRAVLPHFSGQIVWRGQVQTSALAEPLSADANVWLALGRHFVAYYLGDGTINFVAAAERRQWQFAQWVQNAVPNEVRAAFAGWDPHIAELLEACSGCQLWGLFELPELAHWSEGRVVLLGDACHPMLPYQAQGAGAAIEDAYVLTNACASLATNPKPDLQQITKALKAYEIERKPRVRRLQRFSHTNAKLFHSRAAPLLLSIAQRLPVLGNLRLDQIYGFDVTKRDA